LEDKAIRHTAIFTFTLLTIEFLDELVYGAREAAWPLIRTDLALTYAQVGLLLSLPNLASSLVEPFLGRFDIEHMFVYNWGNAKPRR
jgi:FSR family fosmidomycin resistance protein-like MFS transporter